MTKKPKEHNKVNPIYSLYFLRSFNFRDTQDITIVILEVIKTAVFNVARGTFNASCP